VLDILRAARLALEFRANLDRTAFLTDLKTQAAVLHELLVPGEAAKRLSAEFREEHPDVPWKAIAGMRDRLLHGYDDVDLELVWKTVDEDLPALVRRLEELAPRREMQNAHRGFPMGLAARPAG
jgi:uncharacterized protein with HEPN domain